ncbi:uncharacterized protein LOC123223093 [Mangifera indica]|uniref:uncharacterized protein LOC123223093 n=1 Tax=Mangifera indica TaxID=29780 RepID=UPI001CFA1D92|nr:uncharacterized protein LOC123223093 [Mangifera indica]XP_044502097.1 uncharacterized protein LOC123223093 [Mangifera indica]
MSSTSKKRPKPKPDSSSSSVSWVIEPPQSLFPSKRELLNLVAVLAIASSIAVTCNYFSNLFNPTQNPFCDSNIIDSPDSLTDVCEPCPSNGECYQGKLECLHGYRKHGRLCLEDGDINETAKQLAEWVENVLCKAYAQLLCGGTGAIWVQEDDIWNDLDGHELMENFRSDNATYLYTKKRTMETVARFLESRMNSYGVKEVKCPDLLADQYKPFSCRLHQWVFRHALIIVPVCALLVVCSLLLWKFHRRRYLLIRVEELYHQVCEILEEIALMSREVNGECEPWVVASRLRDHLLLPKERKDPVLWKKVEELIQEDSRVDQYPKLLKGESKVVWEWQVEGSLSSSSMRKKEDSIKLKSTEGKDIKFDQQKRMWKAEPKALVF